MITITITIVIIMIVIVFIIVIIVVIIIAVVIIVITIIIVIIIVVIVVVIIVIIIVIHTITKGVVWCGVVGRGGGGQQQAHNFLISPIANTQHTITTTSSSHELVLNGRQPRTRQIKFVLASSEPAVHRLFRHYNCSAVHLLQER
jgi:hypothetical protein